LRARGDRVRVLDDLSTGSESNLAPGAELVRGDVADPAVVRRAMADVDGCFHLAAIASVERGVREWMSTHRANLSGTIGILEEASRAQGRIPVVYASSAAVYGNCDALPLTEDTPAWPLSAYGADKLGCELHARVAGVVHQVPSAGLRFFNVFGPRQDPRSPYSGVISIFCDRLSRGEPVSIFGDGEQTRDFVFVADVVAALVAAMEQVSTAAPVFNICTGRPTSVRELAATVADLCGAHLEVRQQPPRSGEIRHSLGSPRLAQAKLGLSPPEGLSDGLAKVVAWLRAGQPGLTHAQRSDEEPANRETDRKPAYQ